MALTLFNAIGLCATFTYILLANLPFYARLFPMNRQLIHRLLAWKSSKRRKPLLLMGTRQVGKTTLLRRFGEQAYHNVVEINFDDRPDLKRLFESNLTPERILKDISLELDVEIIPAETLLFFDEIQECPNALNSLKYFQENANQYHVCGAGSLLGVKLAHTKGFPVGKVNFEKLYPLSFLEFLEALNQIRLKEYLSTLTLDDTISEPIHEKLLRYLKYYLFVGGMPEAVSTYKETENFSEVREVHNAIIRAYDLDFVKHAPEALVMRITECFHSITSQLAKENKKFIYSVIRQGARARNYEDAIQWLVEAGLFHKIYQTNTAKLPLQAYENRQIFKAYLFDVGLLNTMADLPAKAILQGNALFQEFRGSLTENFVAQEMKQQHERQHYWTSGNTAEVDFIFRHEDLIYPLEVKSGASRQKKSLLVYRDKYKPTQLLRTSPQNLIKQDGFINLPLYLVGELTRLLG